MKKNCTILFITAVCLLTACTESVPESESYQKTEDSHPVSSPDREVQKQEASVPAADDETPDPQDVFDGEAFAAAYAEQLEILYSDKSNMYSYSLIYVDEDEIPELVVKGNMADGHNILTYHEGKVDVLWLNRENFTYLERGNLLCNSDGVSGVYADDVYTIREGKWERLAGGTSEMLWEDGPVQDENGEYVFQYSWNGEDVDQAAYQERLNEVYPVSPENPGKEPERYYILEDLLSLFTSGDVSSAGHRYELVTEDLTWTEAQAACKEKGGYLATVTSVEEWERLTEQIEAEGKSNIIFWMGVKDVHVLEPGVEDGYYMLVLYDALFPFWADGEPGYRGFAEDGTEVKEECGALLYNSVDGRYGLNDMPDDLLSAAPSYAGKIGYICEYSN